MFCAFNLVCVPFKCLIVLLTHVWILLLGGTVQSVVVAVRVSPRRIWWERPEIKFTTYDASPALCVGDSYLPEKNSIFLMMPDSSAKKILSEEKLLLVSNIESFIYFSELLTSSGTMGYSAYSSRIQTKWKIRTSFLVTLRGCKFPGHMVPSASTWNFHFACASIDTTVSVDFFYVSPPNNIDSIPSLRKCWLAGALSLDLL